MSDARPVLIVSHLYEPGVNRVIEILDRMNVPWRRFNCEDFPLLERASVFIDRTDESVRFGEDGQNPFLPQDARSVWYRRLSLPALPRSWQSKDRQFAANEVASMLEGSLFDLHGIFSVNQRQAERRATNKLRQLKAAREVGLAIPETLITNDTAAVRAFRERIGAPIIFKPVSGFAPHGNDFTRHSAERFRKWGEVVTTDNPAEDDVEIVFAQLLDDEKAAGLEAIALCPVMFQRFIPKSADIRVTMVGGSIYACRIHSQILAETRVDFRRMSLLPNTRDLLHEPCELPSETASRITRLMVRLGLVFGCIDLVEEADGTLTFLEVNPAGQWMWIENFTGISISERVAGLLATGQ
jgi:glutathione synthase/RimK-type ligase-like ATP-grasp enzyme